MALDQESQWVLDLVAEANRPKLNTLSPPEARAAYSANVGALDTPKVEVAKVEDHMVPVAGGEILVRTYRSHARVNDQNAPCLVYYHGGGWVIGNVADYDRVCRAMAEKAGIVVASVDYRLAPEHKFPVPVDDSLAAWRWIAGNTEKLGVDPARLAVGGDSAGGNISAVLTQQLAGDDIAPMFQMLIYPATDMSVEHPSWAENAEGKLLDRDLITWFQAQYLPEDADRTDLRLSPMLAEKVAHLPEAFVLTAGADPLRDEGVAYAGRLMREGVNVEHLHMAGQLHGFFNMAGALKGAKRALDAASMALGRALADPAK